MRHTLYLGLIATILLPGSQADAQRGRRTQSGIVVVGTHGHPAHRSVGMRVRGADSLRGERNDLARITDITRSWHRAVRTGNRGAERLADRRIAAWIDAERREAQWSRHRDHRYLVELRRAGRELAAHHWRFATGRARRPHYAHKARILDKLVRLSQQQLFYAKRLGDSGYDVR